ncbi:hypothetical protein GCM10025862_32770 [Arsenicicoccus piscis]|uniref:SGNH hydrolase-type esterase domain-containing protein n=1 Tax=Arsenicicoccus piscis TaxID=673954 RepID=A0ABQ6HSG8_9MICO|nr:hypothetical protein GCM10025862_32770 [Arsenicicoccus piscis]
MRRAPTSVALAATGLLTVAGTVVAIPELPGLAHRLAAVAAAQPSGPAAGGADGRAANATAPATSRPLPDVHRVVALGDSVPEGSACDCAAYPELVAQSLQTRLGHPVSVDNLGEAGSTSTDLAESLRSDPTTRTAVSGPTWSSSPPAPTTWPTSRTASRPPPPPPGHPGSPQRRPPWLPMWRSCTSWPRRPGSS